MSTSARNHHADGQLHHAGSRAVAPSQRLLRRPTLAETERIARNCPAEGLSVTVIVQTIRRETGCSRATAYRAVSDAFAAGYPEPEGERSFVKHRSRDSARSE
jgi:hypothetical protein